MGGWLLVIGVLGSEMINGVREKRLCYRNVYFTYVALKLLFIRKHLRSLDEN